MMGPNCGIPSWEWPPEVSSLKSPVPFNSVNKKKRQKKASLTFLQQTGGLENREQLLPPSPLPAPLARVLKTFIPVLGEGWPFAHKGHPRKEEQSQKERMARGGMLSHYLSFGSPRGYMDSHFPMGWLESFQSSETGEWSTIDCPLDLPVAT